MPRGTRCLNLQTGNMVLDSEHVPVDYQQRMAFPVRTWLQLQNPVPSKACHGSRLCRTGGQPITGVSSTRWTPLITLISQWRVSKVNTNPINIWLIAHHGPPGGKRDDQNQTREKKGLQIISKTLGRRSAREQFGCSAEFAISTTTTQMTASRIRQKRQPKQWIWIWDAAKRRRRRMKLLVRKGWCSVCAQGEYGMHVCAERIGKQCMCDN